MKMESDTVRAQGGKLKSAAQELSTVAGSWTNMFGSDRLGAEYQTEAAAIVAGFEAVTAAVKNWSGACTAFGDALTNSANSLQYTDAQFSNEINRISFDAKGDLTSGGK